MSETKYFYGSRVFMTKGEGNILIETCELYKLKTYTRILLEQITVHVNIQSFLNKKNHGTQNTI